MHSARRYPRRHVITVEEYFRMREAHVFDQHIQLELIEGELIEMPPVSDAHTAVVNRLAALLELLAR